MAQTSAFITVLAACLTLIFSCSPASKKLPDDQPRRIEILFLGHGSEHHNSREYAPILASALTKKGINISYSENLDDLNKANLNLFDGIIIYANHDSISLEQDKALMDYISAGHALIPIHCASFCFRNSQDYVNAVGGQFKSHKTDTFTAKIIDKSHPITESLGEFSTWDETYVHDKIGKEIHILMERQEGDVIEPWTWTNSFGEGKVFYTAYGHDERTWNNPGFHQLIENGILWAIDDQAKTNWQSFSKDIPILSYEEMTNIPNYEKRDPAPKYQLPLSPQESEMLIQVPPGFKVELFAAEPDIINPIAMNWDEKGRLWVIETVDYPNSVRNDKGQGDDRIKICEDTDGDGKADKFTVFAEGLNIPTSFTFANGGIIVSQAPQFLFLKDTNGDDIADVREVIIDGWGIFDTHAGPSNLQMGIDNKIYGSVGYSGFKGNIFGKPAEFRQGLYSFNSDYSNFEFLTKTSNNTWGLGITENNSIFASTANNTHSVFVPIPDKHFKGLEGIPAQGNEKIDGHYNMFTISPNIRQVDVFGGFTAAAGHHFYTAREFPEAFHNRAAFVCEPTGGVAHVAIIEEKGAGYIESDGGNLIASSDEWFSPVEAKTGPDGAVWVLDWYNFIVQHNPTPRRDRGGFDAENGDGNAYINPLRDKSRGRIWKISPKNFTNASAEKWNLSDDKDLLAALSDDNMFWRLTAQRLIVENKRVDLQEDLIKLIANSKLDNDGENYCAMHSIWCISALMDVAKNEKAKSSLIQALNHPSPAVRKATIQAIPRMKWADEAIVDEGLIFDKDPKVQLATLLYFSEREPYLVSSPEEVGRLIYELSEKPNTKTDKWLSVACYIAAVKHRGGFIASFFESNPNYQKEENNHIVFEAKETDDNSWDEMQLPNFIENAGLDIDGVIWFRKKFNLKNITKNGTSTLSLGPIDDSDVTYINGTKVGNMEKSYDVNRIYNFPSSILKEGENLVAVRMEDTGGGGGIYGSKEEMFIDHGKEKLSLAGPWKYYIEEDYTNSSKSIFKNMSIAEVLIHNYMDKTVVQESDQIAKEDKARIVKIKTVKNEMKYDIENFTAMAGEIIELHLENTDFMQHNLIILSPGSLEKVGAATDKLAADPNGSQKYYIPEMPEVLFSTKLVNPQETAILRFKVPEELGIYPYICTFPGHWQIMQGNMIVKENNITI